MNSLKHMLAGAFLSHSRQEDVRDMMVRDPTSYNLINSSIMADQTKSKKQKEAELNLYDVEDAFTGQIVD